MLESSSGEEKELITSCFIAVITTLINESFPLAGTNWGLNTAFCGLAVLEAFPCLLML